MQDWSKMRTKWQQIRDLKRVPKGAGGTNIKIGEALNQVGVAQAKGLKPFIDELKKFDVKLAAYKTAIDKKAKAQKPSKDPKAADFKGFADWIEDNIAEWVDDDKKAAEKELPLLLKAVEAIDVATWKMITGEGLNRALTNAEVESGAAQGRDPASGDPQPLVAEDAGRIEGVFARVNKSLDKIIAISAQAKVVYGANSKIPIAAAFATLGTRATRFKARVAETLDQPTWGKVRVHFRTVLGGDSADWQMSDLSALDKAVRNRIS